MYRRMEWFAEQYGVCVRTVDRRIDWIRKHGDRYPTDAVVRNGNIPYVREDVFEDVIKNMNKVDAGLAPKFIPERMREDQNGRIG